MLNINFQRSSFNFKLQFQVSTSSFNFKFQFQISILSFNFKFEFQALIPSSNFKFQFQVSISSFNIKFQYQVLISSFNFKFQFQVSISSLNFKFQFHVSVSTSSIKFQFQVTVSSYSFLDRLNSNSSQLLLTSSSKNNFIWSKNRSGKVSLIDKFSFKLLFLYFFFNKLKQVFWGCINLRSRNSKFFFTFSNNAIQSLLSTCVC